MALSFNTGVNIVIEDDAQVAPSHTGKWSEQVSGRKVREAESEISDCCAAAS